MADTIIFDEHLCNADGFKLEKFNRPTRKWVSCHVGTLEHDDIFRITSKPLDECSDDIAILIVDGRPYKNASGIWEVKTLY